MNPLTPEQINHLADELVSATPVNAERLAIASEQLRAFAKMKRALLDAFMDGLTDARRARAADKNYCEICAPQEFRLERHRCAEHAERSARDPRP